MSSAGPVRGVLIALPALVGCGPLTIAWDCPQGIVFNEILTKTHEFEGPEDLGGSSPDWIELFNGGQRTVDLWNFRVVRGRVDAWYDPPLALESGLEVERDAFLLVIADSVPFDTGGQADYVHAAFALNREGGDLGLYGPEEHGLPLCASLPYDSQHVDASFGRFPDGADDCGLMDDPSPGTRNRPPDEMVECP